MAGDVYGAKMERWVAQARELGLEVEVQDHSEGILQSVTVVIRRPQVEAQNMLDQVRNAESIFLHAVRCFNEGRWSNTARHSGWTEAARYDIAVSRVHYHIASLAENN